MPATATNNVAGKNMDFLLLGRGSCVPGKTLMSKSKNII